MATNESTRFLLRLSIASLVLTAAVAIIAVLADEFDDTTGNVVLTTLAISLYIATGSAGVSVLDRPDLRVAGIATIVASGFALLFAIGMIWDEWQNEDWTEAWGGDTAITLALTQAVVVLGRRRPGDAPSVRGAIALTLTTGPVLALLVIIAIVADVEDDSGGRLLAILAVLNVLGMVLLPILRRLGAVQEPVPTAAAASAETVVLAAGRLDAEVTLLGADGAELLLAPVDLSDGGRLAALRTPREIRVLIERAP